MGQSSGVDEFIILQELSKFNALTVNLEFGLSHLMHNYRAIRFQDQLHH